MPTRQVALHDGMFQTSLLEAGAGPPLLYLHGTWATDGGPFLERLADSGRVIAPRLPGFGDSTGSEHLLDLPDLIYYQLDLLDALELRGLPLIGHSLGGMVAAELAAVQPERFSHLVLLAPLGLWNAEYPVPDFFAFSPPDLAAALYADPESPVAQQAARVPLEEEERISYELDVIGGWRPAPRTSGRPRTAAGPHDSTGSEPRPCWSGVSAMAWSPPATPPTSRLACPMPASKSCPTPPTSQWSNSPSGWQRWWKSSWRPDGYLAWRWISSRRVRSASSPRGVKMKAVKSVAPASAWRFKPAWTSDSVPISATSATLVAPSRSRMAW
jgi:pimeloyl-ACP methyl ester carboxylesterase